MCQNPQGLCWQRMLGGTGMWFVVQKIIYWFNSLIQLINLHYFNSKILVCVPPPALSGQSVQQRESTWPGVKSLLWPGVSALQFLHPGLTSLHSGHPLTWHQGQYEVDGKRNSSMTIMAWLEAAGDNPIGSDDSLFWSLLSLITLLKMKDQTISTSVPVIE